MIATYWTTELHAHLYGCLTASDIHELGRDLWRERQPRLEWYEGEYAAAFGRRPSSASYWKTEDGLETLTADFCGHGPESFSQFQARFNLLIALFPVIPGDLTVLRRALERQSAAGIVCGEYRCPLPPQLTAVQIGTYAAGLADGALAFACAAGGSFTPQLAFSLSRQPDLGIKQHQVLRDLLGQRPDLAKVITAVDFCGAEAGQPPDQTAPLITAIHDANLQDPAHALAILYHVGETFEDRSQDSAIRWIWQAWDLGAHRLGHALALGLAPEVVRSMERRGTESAAERRRHLQWLLREQHWLAGSGFAVNQKAIAAELQRLGSVPETALIPVATGPEAEAQTRLLQRAVTADLVRRGAIIESCPTSNYCLGQLKKWTDQPLPWFLRHGLRVVVGADDPGLFATTLGAEEHLAATALGLTDEERRHIGQNAERFGSPALCRL